MTGLLALLPFLARDILPSIAANPRCGAARSRAVDEDGRFRRHFGYSDSTDQRHHCYVFVMGSLYALNGCVGSFPSDQPGFQPVRHD
jgi:hypothetical protein